MMSDRDPVDLAQMNEAKPMFVSLKAAICFVKSLLMNVSLLIHSIYLLSNSVMHFLSRDAPKPLSLQTAYFKAIHWE